MTEYEGLQNEVPNWVLPSIGTFTNIYPENDYIVNHEAFEFSSICPRTGLPDFGTVKITFVPDELCLELKSLKLYLNDFRNRGIFMENACNRIFDDIQKVIEPKELRVEITFNSRGGIGTTVVRELTK